MLCACYTQACNETPGGISACRHSHACRQSKGLAGAGGFDVPAEGADAEPSASVAWLNEAPGASKLAGGCDNLARLRRWSYGGRHPLSRCVRKVLSLLSSRLQTVQIHTRGTGKSAMHCQLPDRNANLRRLRDVLHTPRAGLMSHPCIPATRHTICAVATFWRRVGQTPVLLVLVALTLQCKASMQEGC